MLDAEAEGLGAAEAPGAGDAVDFDDLLPETRYPEASAADLQAYDPCLVLPKYLSPSRW